MSDSSSGQNFRLSFSTSFTLVCNRITSTFKTNDCATCHDGESIILPVSSAYSHIISRRTGVFTWDC